MSFFNELLDEFSDCNECQYAWRDIGVLLIVTGGVILFSRWWVTNIYDPVREAENTVREAIDDIRGI